MVNKHLALMGIKQWRERDRQPMVDCQQISAYIYQLRRERLCGLLIAQHTDGSSAEADLVQAIVKATGYAGEGSLSVWPNDDLSQLPQHAVIILLGEQLAPQVDVSNLQQQGYQIFVSYSPNKLLKTPKLKAQTWQKLKKAMQSLATL